MMYYRKQINLHNTISMKIISKFPALVLTISVLLTFIPDAKSAWRDPVRAKNAIVASQHELASKIGADIMKRGGNAVDAAIAVGLALAVVYPEAGNLGGGGFMLIRFKDGKTTAIDYREMAPKAASRDIFVDERRRSDSRRRRFDYRLSRVGRSRNPGRFRYGV